MSFSNLKSILSKKQYQACSQAQTLDELRDALSILKVQNPDAAAIDIGSMEQYVAVPAHLSSQTLRAFPAFSRDLKALGNWLVEIGVKSVVMESTGPYWQCLYEILEERGMELYVVNARHAKNVNGRKSDVLDCQWLLELHTHGLLGASFIPKAGIRELRTYSRRRESLLDDKTRALQAIQRALTAMNLKFQHHLSDLEGASAQKIVRAIAQGEQDPEVLAKHRHFNMKVSQEELIKGLEGNYRPEHLFSLQQALDTWDFHQAQIQACDQQIEKCLAALPCGDQGQDEIGTLLAPLKTKPRKNGYSFDAKAYLCRQLGGDLTVVDGLGVKTLMDVYAEIGADLSPWKHHNFFTSWLGLSPNPQISGGKVIGHKRLKTRNRAGQAFRKAAMSLANSHCYLGHYYRKTCLRKGKKVAIKAVARKLAIIYYKMVKEKVPYRPQKLKEYQNKQKARKEKYLRKMAGEMGFELIESK